MPFTQHIGLMDASELQQGTKLLTQWLYPGTEPTYFSYVPEKYGLVAA